MGLDDDQMQLLDDVRWTGEAIAKMRPLFRNAPLPLPFRLPSEASWAQFDPSNAFGPDDDLAELNSGGASSDDFDDASDEEIAEREETANEAGDAGPVLAGVTAEVGTLRATCTFLIHGDPRMHRLTSAVLSWAAKQQNRVNPT